jgi:hypothetical protein
MNEIIIAALIELAINSHCAPLGYAKDNLGRLQSVERCRLMLNRCVYDDKKPIVECFRMSNLTEGK